MKSFLYHLFILAYALNFLPGFQKEPLSIPIGSVDLFLPDICFLLIFFFYLPSLLKNRNKNHIRAEGKDLSSSFSIILLTFYLFTLLKFIFQNYATHEAVMDTTSIRTWVAYSIGYLLVLFLPNIIESINAMKWFVLSGTWFAMYIFLFHIYKYATIGTGYALHVLGGEFLPVLAFIFFLLAVGKDLLKINIIYSYVIRVLILTTYFMVGHRSGFIALIIGALCLFFLPGKRAILQQYLLLFVSILILLVTMVIVAPSLTSKLEKHASTTFDVEQQTYQDRYHNYFAILEKVKEYPILGRPFGARNINYSAVVHESEHGITRGYRAVVMSPHNLILEWLYFFGGIGMFTGILLLIVSFSLITRLLKKYQNEISYRRFVVGLLCVWAHNLFFVLSNASVSSVYSVFFLYLPLAMMVALDRVPLQKNRSLAV